MAQTHRTQERAPKRDNDEARFEAWLKDFETRMADLTARQEALLRDLGVEPQKDRARARIRLTMALGGIGPVFELLR